jgi:serine/threonine protein kinase
VRTRIADYDIFRPLPGADTWLAWPPPRLSTGDDAVQVTRVTTTPAGWDDLVSFLQRLARAASPHLPTLFEHGPDRAGDDQGAGGDTPTVAGYWSQQWPGDRTLASPGGSPARPGILAALAAAARGTHALHQVGLVHGHVSAGAIHLDGPVPGLDLPPWPGHTPAGLIMTLHDPADLDTVDPALVRGGRPSRTTDIWALGAVAHRALTGQLLHPALPGDPVVTAVQRAAFEPPTLDPGLDPGLADLLGSCLAPDPARRPRTAAELADRLDALAARP